MLLGFLAGCAAIRSGCGQCTGFSCLGCLSELCKQTWLSMFPGKEGCLPPSPWDQPQLSGNFLPLLQKREDCPTGLQGGEVPLHPGHLRSCRMAFQSRSFKARLCLLAPASPSSLPLRSITHSDSLVFEKLPAPRSPCLQIHQWQHKGKT